MEPALESVWRKQINLLTIEAKRRNITFFENRYLIMSTIKDLIENIQFTFLKTTSLAEGSNYTTFVV